MKVIQFEDCDIWQKAQILVTEIRSLLLLNRDYSFKDQIMRAGVSISNNIAEGFERRTNKELKQFLFISKGSCGEVRSMLHLGYKWDYFAPNDYTKLHNASIEISKMLSGRIKYL